MKYLKLFENKEERQRMQDLFNEVTYFIEELQPVSKEEGFQDCLYDYDYDGKILEISFYFKFSTDEESYEKFYKFLKDYGLKVDNERDARDYHEITIIPNKRLIKKLIEDTEIWSNANKYNL
jgi:effector-binding domain-containing protein